MLSQQFCAMARIKYLMVRLSFQRLSLTGRVVIAVLFFLFLLLSSGAAFLLYYLAQRIGTGGKPAALLLLLDGAASLYLFFFLWSFLIELQRGEGIGLDKLLSLPIRPLWVYLFNFILFAATPLFFFSLPPLLALALGLVKSYGIAALLWLAGFSLLFFVALNAWAYYLCSVLALWMINKRRRRLVFMIVPMAFVALAQVPTLLLRIFLSKGEGALSPATLESHLSGLLSMHRHIPFLWPLHGIWNSLTGMSYQESLLSILGSMLLILAGLYLGYRAVLRYYRSGHSESPAESGGKTARAGLRNNHKTSDRSIFTPFLSPEMRCLTRTFFQSCSRHPHLRMLFLMPASMGLLLLFMYKDGSLSGGATGGRQWIPHFWLFLPFLNFSFFLFNIFGIDGRSFQTLMLLPVPRYRYLLAKNLALAPFIFGLSFFLFVTSFFFNPMDLMEIVTVVLLVLHLFLIFSATGNFYSLYFPQVVRRDVMRAPVSRLHMMRHMLILTLLSGCMVFPASSCFAFRNHQFLSWGLGNVHIPAGLMGALILFFLSCLYYRGSLYRAGDLLQEREQLIFAILAREHD